MVITYKTLGNKPLSASQRNALRRAGWDVRLKAYPARPPVWRASLSGSASKRFSSSDEALAEWQRIVGHEGFKLHLQSDDEVTGEP